MVNSPLRHHKPSEFVEFKKKWIYLIRSFVQRDLMLVLLGAFIALLGEPVRDWLLAPAPIKNENSNIPIEGNPQNIDDKTVCNSLVARGYTCDESGYWQACNNGDTKAVIDLASIGVRPSRDRALAWYEEDTRRLLSADKTLLDEFLNDQQFKNSFAALRRREGEQAAAVIRSYNAIADNFDQIITFCKNFPGGTIIGREATAVYADSKECIDSARFLKFGGKAPKLVGIAEDILQSLQIPDFLDVSVRHDVLASLDLVYLNAYVAGKISIDFSAPNTMRKIGDTFVSIEEVDMYFFDTGMFIFEISERTKSYRFARVGIDFKWVKPDKEAEECMSGKRLCSGTVITVGSWAKLQKRTKMFGPQFKICSMGLNHISIPTGDCP